MEVRYPPEEVLDVLGKLTPEHYVEVKWIDASEMREATEQDIEQGYETPVKAVGRVYHVLGDYLIIQVESSPVLGLRVLNIPLGCIKKIKVLTKRPVKKPLRVMKQLHPYKVVYHFVKITKNQEAQNSILLFRRV